MSQLIRKEYSWSVTLKVEDTALIWTLRPANKKGSLYMQNVTTEVVAPECLLLICLGLHTKYISAFIC